MKKSDFISELAGKNSLTDKQAGQQEEDKKIVTSHNYE